MAANILDPEIIERLKAIRLAVFDVDGVLTDGGLSYVGEIEFKRFHVRDGLGLKQLMRCGVEVAWITARSSALVQQRAKELDIERLSMADGDKLKTLKRFASELNLSPEQVFYMGDDLVDLAPIGWAGVSATPADAASDLLSTADIITKAEGGKGAAREVAEAILRAQGKWQSVVDSYKISGNAAEGRLT